jgi:hypothetical protein
LKHHLQLRQLGALRFQGRVSEDIPEFPKRLEGFKFEVYGTGLPDRDHLEYKCMIRVEEEWGWMIADMDIQRLELVSTNTDD